MIAKHLLPKCEDEKDIKALEEKAERLRKIYCDIINKFIKDIEVTKIDDFNDINWAFKRAYRDGQIEGMLKVLNLIGGFNDRS
jgi:hypothetical protein